VLNRDESPYETWFLWYLVAFKDESQSIAELRWSAELGKVRRSITNLPANPTARQTQPGLQGLQLLEHIPGTSIRRPPGPTKRSRDEVLDSLAHALSLYCRARYIELRDCARDQIAEAAGYGNKKSLDNLMNEHGLNNFDIILRTSAFLSETAKPDGISTIV
jgi:hypothetical protein